VNRGAARGASAGDRAGSCASQGAAPERDSHAAGRFPESAGGRRPRRLRPAANSAGDDRLEPRPAERRRSVSVGGEFGGPGWHRPASLTAICDSALDLGVPVLDAVQELVDHSLLRLALTSGLAPRYAMLETVREFAAQQLSTMPAAAAVHEAHARQFQRLAKIAHVLRSCPPRTCSICSSSITTTSGPPSTGTDTRSRRPIAATRFSTPTARNASPPRPPCSASPTR
jgi:hypothetical protein